LSRIYSLSVRNLLLLLAPAVIVLSIFAPQILRTWLGAEFADRSALALRLLAIGVTINGLSHVPCGYLQASGRPDVPAKFHVLELAIHLPLTWILVRSWGIPGAALAWTIRVTLDGSLLFLASKRVLGMSPGRALRPRGGRVAIALTGLIGAMLAIAYANLSLPLGVVLCAFALAGFALVVWLLVFEQSERAAIYGAIGIARSGTSSARRAVAS
jgi:O-antigen/teichoic acid export membrane protein